VFGQVLGDQRVERLVEGLDAAVVEVVEFQQERGDEDDRENDGRAESRSVTCLGVGGGQDRVVAAEVDRRKKCDRRDAEDAEIDPETKK
jgi:hypothetical protein